MIDDINVLILIYIFAIIIQGFLTSLNRSYWGLLSIIATSILYIVIQDRNIFTLVWIQTCLYGVIRLTKHIVTAYILKKRNNSIDISKIKDL